MTFEYTYCRYSCSLAIYFVQRGRHHLDYLDELQHPFLMNVQQIYLLMIQALLRRIDLLLLFLQQNLLDLLSQQLTLIMQSQ